MQVVISPSAIKGSIVAPASKSLMQRACAAALLRKGTTTLVNYGKSNDDKAVLQLLQHLGADIIYLDETRLQIISAGLLDSAPANDILDCGESGLAVRMFTPLLALLSTPITITGLGSLMQRPMHFFDEILPQLGVDVNSVSGKLPLQIKGPLEPKNITVDGSLSSQFLTGLLFAYSAADAKDVTISCINLNSKPYIDLTLKVLADFGMKVPVNKDYKEFVFTEGNKMSHQIPTSGYVIESDWSSASFLMVAGAIAGNIIIKGLDVFTEQADKKILEALQDCGCRLSIQMESIEVSAKGLQPFHFDATECPDLFPPLVALAAYCNGTSVIEGAERLIYKESNRAISLQEQFSKLGIGIAIQDDKMIIKGGTGVKAAHVDSCHDHRIAMACAVAALAADGKVTIDNADAVNKSYPGFYADLRSLMIAG